MARRDDPAIYSFEIVDEDGRFLFMLPLPEVLNTARKARKRVRTSEIRALMEKNRVLRKSLIEQIEHTRTNIDTTYDLLRTLRQRE